ncbi:hypothetical protein GQR58_030342 [Nymphon striatum]|nr:hypothetical protein GQR58_030342 [Nymphon striatum]
MADDLAARRSAHDVLETEHAADFFGNVSFGFGVPAPRRNRDRQTFVVGSSIDLEADAGQMRAHGCGIDVGAEQAIDLAHAYRQGSAVRCRAVLTLDGARDAWWIPPCHFDEHRCGAVADLGISAAHYASKANGDVVAIGDHAVAGHERALGAIEGGDLLAVVCTADLDVTTRYGCQVIGVLGSQVASNTGDRHGVGTVGVDLEVPQHIFGDAECVVDRSAECSVGLTSEQHDAVAVVAKADFAGRAAHAVGHFAAHLALGDFHAVGHSGADGGERDQIADGHVERAAAHLQRLPVASIDLNNLNLVGIRMWRQVQDLGQHNAVETLTGDGHLFDRKPKRAQRLAELYGIALDTGREFLQPGQQYLHAIGLSFEGAEADVVVHEFTDVVELVAHNGQAVDAETEGKALPDLGVNAAVAEHVGVHHAAAAKFKPAAVGATDVELCGRLGEREVRRTKAALDVGAKERLHELVDGASEVTHGDALVDDKAFDLVERRQVRGVGSVSAEGATGSDDVHEDGVEAATSGVPLGDVERFEVVPSGLDLGAFSHGVAHTHEHVFETITSLRDQVQVAGVGLHLKLGQVKPLCFESDSARCARKICVTGGKGCFDCLSSGIDCLSGFLALIWLQRTEIFLRCGNGRFLAKQRRAKRLERVEITCSVDLGNSVCC